MAEVRPVRLRLSRAMGFNLQAHSCSLNGLPAVNVARPGPFGNPFVVGRDGSREDCAYWHGCMLLYSSYAMKPQVPIAELRRSVSTVRARWRELRGHNLACWCALDGKPCHADNLFKAVEILEAENG